MKQTAHDFKIGFAGDYITVCVDMNYWNNNFMEADREVRRIAKKKGFGNCIMESLPDFDESKITFIFQLKPEQREKDKK